MSNLEKASWRAILRGHHDFVAAASAELGRRLRRAVEQRAADDPARQQEWSAVMVALEAELRALDRVIDPFTGRVRKPLLDWEVIAAGDPRSIDEWLTRVRAEVCVRVVAEPAAPGVAWHPLPTPPPDVADPAEPITFVLTAFNARNGHARRRPLEALVDRLARGEDVYPRLCEKVQREWADEQRGLLHAFGALTALAQGYSVVAPSSPAPGEVIGSPLEGWPWVLGPDEGALARAAPAPANWMVRTTLRAFRPEEYRARADARNQPRGLSPDTWCVLRSWGYSKRIHVTMSEESGKRDTARIHQGVEAAVAAARRHDG